MHGPKDRRGAPDLTIYDRADGMVQEFMRSHPPVKAEDVVGWFAARCVVDAANPEVHALADAVNGVRWMEWMLRRTDPTGDPGHEKTCARVRSIQVSLANLLRHLPWYLQDLCQELESPETEHLRSILNHVEALHAKARTYPRRRASFMSVLSQIAAGRVVAHGGRRPPWPSRAAYLFPSSRGPAMEKPWQRHAELLLEPIRRVFQSAGHRKLSLRQGGALVAVICRALSSIDGKRHAPTKVESHLKRAGPPPSVIRAAWQMDIPDEVERPK
jgi:hypothetical protein